MTTAHPSPDQLDEPPVPERILPGLEAMIGSIDDLAEFEGNPREHDEPAIAEVLREFGQVAPLVVNVGTITGRGRELVGGHGRLRVMRRHGWTQVAWVEHDWTDAQARKLLAALNGSERRARTNPKKNAAFLASVLEDLHGSTWTLADLETDLAQRDDDIAEHAEQAERGHADSLAALEAEDTPPRADGSSATGETGTVVLDPPAEPVTQLGDVWELGPHRLICASSTSSDIAARLDVADVNVIITDPPYCSGGWQEGGKHVGSVGSAGPHKQIANDRLSTRGYCALIRETLERVPAPFAYVFTEWKMWGYLEDVAGSSGYQTRSMIVWDKGSPGMGLGWRAEHELILWAAREKPSYPKNYGGKGNVLQASRTGNDLHTTQKPEEIIAELLENTPFVRAVYDPFTGSGTVLMACDAAGVPCRAAELDRGYCDVTARRWQRRTGRLPVRNGQPHDFLASTTPDAQDA